MIKTLLSNVWTGIFFLAVSLWAGLWWQTESELQCCSWPACPGGKTGSLTDNLLPITTISNYHLYQQEMSQSAVWSGDSKHHSFLNTGLISCSQIKLSPGFNPMYFSRFCLNLFENPAHKKDKQTSLFKKLNRTFVWAFWSWCIPSYTENVVVMWRRPLHVAVVLLLLFYFCFFSRLL